MTLSILCVLFPTESYIFCKDITMPKTRPCLDDEEQHSPENILTLATGADFASLGSVGRAQITKPKLLFVGWRFWVSWQRWASMPKPLTSRFDPGTLTAKPPSAPPTQLRLRQLLRVILFRRSKKTWFGYGSCTGNGNQKLHGVHLDVQLHRPCRRKWRFLIAQKPSGTQTCFCFFNQILQDFSTE